MEGVAHASPLKRSRASHLQYERLVHVNTLGRLAARSLFDLERSTPKEIARCTAEGMSRGRLKALQKGAGAQIVEHKKRLKTQAGW